MTKLLLSNACTAVFRKMTAGSPGDKDDRYPSCQGALKGSSSFKYLAEDWCEWAVGGEVGSRRIVH